MTVEPVCEICGASDPKWLRSVDESIVDYAWRTFRGFPGPTSRPVRYCDTPDCGAAVEARYGPSGNRAALNRLIDALGEKNLDADDNEVRLTALMAERPNRTEKST